MLIKNIPNGEYVQEVTRQGRFITGPKKDAADFTPEEAAEFVRVNGPQFEAIEG